MFNPESILYEDNHLIVVNKRSGELVQSDTTGDPALEDEIKAFIHVRDDKPGNVFLGVVHRIDRPVSGAVLFAKTGKALTRMNELVKNREIRKIYWALTENRPQQPEGELVHHLARDGKIAKIFWPSSIGAFGPHTRLDLTPQYTVMDPDTVYGISKLSGELWCRYYNERYGVDVRSVRFPGIISWKAAPGGGTTDYAVDIFHKAVTQGSYEGFLREDTYLPMIYMPDALRAIVELMDAPADRISVRTSYNLASMSFSPAELARVVEKLVPGFTITYAPDFRQHIADTWPDALDDAYARQDWGWQPEYDIETMAADMVENLRRKYGRE